ncbi:MAG: NAD-dependent epimerase/dehydratase family protein [Solirubrobacterales bacterium]
MSSPGGGGADGEDVAGGGAAADDAGAAARAGIELAGRRVAVTGAAGFIGAALCRRLAAEGAEVIGIDVAADAAARIRDDGAEPRIADIAEREGIRAALEDAELVIHTAAYVREWGEMEEFIDVNVQGTVNVLDAAELAGAERVLHLSSVVVYGYEDPSEQDEAAFHRAVGIPYIDTKAASDRIALGRGAVVVRPGDVYGPGSVPWLLRPAELMRRGMLALPDRGDGTMLPVYIDDLVDGIVAALRRGRPGSSYTLWDGEPVSFSEYFTRLAELTGGKPPRNLPRPVLRAVAGATELAARLRGRAPAFGRHGVTLVDRRGTVSNRRAREELGWEPRVGLDEGIRRGAASLGARG